MKRAALFMGLAASLVVLGARADTPPSAWDTARDPELEASWRLHVDVRRLLDQRGPKELQSFARKARDLLDNEHAESSRFSFLRFDLGVACKEVRDYECVLRVLPKAIEDAPDSPFLFEAYDALAFAYALLDRSKDERRICDLYVPKVTDQAVRASLLLNCAEAAMHLGQLDVAVAQYQEAIDVTATLPNFVAIEQQTDLLSVWGMTVAFDRRHDVYEAGVETQLALSLDPGMQVIQRGPNVFFSPERERFWYVALGYQRLAQTAENAEAAAVQWQRAEGCWRDYIDDVSARAAQDRWVDQARAHFASAHAARLTAEKKAKRRIPDVERSCVD